MFKFNLKSFLITLFISIVLDVLVLFYADAFDFPVAYINATFTSGILLFGAAILTYASSEGLFDMAIYGTTKFFKYMFSSKKVKMDSYFEYYLKKHENDEVISVFPIILVGIIQLLICFILYFF
ncbi:DUF3899 domain-containing protein [Haloplasma contractile]|uniref:DUF3899 domain-containing protein n=1 Tax=Haloplasma contractile SSD-17B TaxID=1033810 RepID=U2FQ13_9MOLU|nr:DUF3899 domain-containing protein [Haloplasma contractile]ERJ13134.1 hypothetical protein HLPCO_000753 [Haloplasma contractile SSD-17B]